MFVSTIGTLAAVLGILSIIPQVAKTMRTRHTKDLSILWLIIAGGSLTCWVIYGIMRGDMTITLGNGFLLILVLILLGYKIKFG